MEPALVGFDVRQCGRRDPISKRAPSGLFSRVCPNFFSCTGGIGNVAGDFETRDGSKNRRLSPCKMSISEVLISATLSVRGEVAERLKAAVC